MDTLLVPLLLTWVIAR
ncbi:hypothetical protein LINPERHAP1_LOCUS25872 [Linum perenne]